MSDPAIAFRHRLQVRFRDCDAQGHVNHAVFFTYFEQCRLSWWRELGGGPGMPGAATVIVHADCDYRAPAFVHDELEVRLRLESIGRTSVSIAYEIVNVADARLLATGRSINVTVDSAARTPIPVPEATRALLSGAPPAAR